MNNRPFVINDSFMTHKFVDRAKAIEDNEEPNYIEFNGITFTNCDFNMLARRFTNAKELRTYKFYERANFTNCEFIDCDFRYVAIKNAMFSKCVIRNTTFEYAELTSTAFYFSQFHSVNFCGVDLHDATLESTFYKTDFCSALLHGVNMRTTNGLVRISGIGFGAYDLFVTDWGDEGIRIKAGCRWFNEQKAIEHWGNVYYHSPKLGKKYIAAIEFAKQLLYQEEGTINE